MDQLRINSKETVSSITKFILTFFHHSSFSHVVLGLSGGIDSAVVTALSVQALGSENVFPILLPYGDLNQKGIEQANALIETLKIPLSNCATINIQPFVDPLIGLDPGMDLLRKGNLMVRVRMIILYDSAKKIHALVAGTENKTEYLLGYYTRFGDEASDVEPIRHLYKTQVYQLAQELRIPESICSAVPTAGLQENQTDEGDFGFSYKDADQILALYYDKKFSQEQVAKEGFNKETIEKVLNRSAKNRFKHETPYTIENFKL